MTKDAFVRVAGRTIQYVALAILAFMGLETIGLLPTLLLVAAAPLIGEFVSSILSKRKAQAQPAA